ncbi:Phosphatidylserine decarboxylase proenzyme 3 [Beauveria bassiana]|nr:Phosphatidylserine decarboxylase proenzyme 3 [Beauveria bassiana]KAH8720747.1 Phosphatidylserine decarboxylase proenzyme 3 [Beauveria bassiana]
MSSHLTTNIAPPSANTERFSPIITLLTGYLKAVCPGELDKAVKTACSKFPHLTQQLKITDEASFLSFANTLLKWTPTETQDGTYIYNIFCIFYFVFDQGKLGELQTPIRPDQVGKDLTCLSSWIVVYSQLVGQVMDTPESITPKSLETFKNAPRYSYDDAVVPPGGWRTFNDFFARKLKPGKRPIDSQGNDKVVVYPADCTYDNSIERQSIVTVGGNDSVTIKGLSWTISSLLEGSANAEDFQGGVWMHAYLNTYNYHRQHAPVSGKIIEARNIQGTAYLEVDVDGNPVRHVEGPHMPDSPGYQFLQTRGVVVIDNPVLGKVAVLPIGMAMISSVKLEVKVGDQVKKGDEISYFQFGGSDIICVFQKKAGLTPEHFKKSPSEEGITYSKMGSVLAKCP